MRCIVVGLGIQGRKRKHYAGTDFVACVDPLHSDADYSDLFEITLDRYDTALVCTPDEPKVGILKYLLANKKNVMVEKPLFAAKDEELLDLQQLAQANEVMCYTAYNHRFEPHFVAMRELIQSGRLGKIYRCRMFYGNGTARLVRESAWRDSGAGVLPDLGSHLLDTVAFWFGISKGNITLVSADKFENNAPDHVVLSIANTSPTIELEMTLLMWRNHFTCDILAEKGTAHIESLCKWGPSTLRIRERVLPSGRPIEVCNTLIQQDPTWAIEYAHFKHICANKQKTDLSSDIWLNSTLRELSYQVTMNRK